ncbi:MAG: GTP-binding protein [Sedimentisphaerales bacterium]|nr:GTP-binding protein [Sedimentisphaerales bacterium]
MSFLRKQESIISMYRLNDTIVAVSSPTNDHRVILRLTGSQVIDILHRMFTPSVPDKAGITAGRISVNTGLNLDSVIYLFRQPHSYTGDDLAEIHLWANPAVTEALMERLLALGIRPAAPGEFTARAYLNNKIDLAQAEAVNEVITATNTFQLAAAENLLAGQLGQTSKVICESILDLLSRLEADLDFSTEDIVPTNQPDIITTLGETISQLQDLLSGSVQSESMLDLPAVGIAGAPNAGKSTLLNKLLGRQRSIVSHQRKTTRDVLTGELTISGCRCVLFDCAGLLVPSKPVLSVVERVEGTMHAETILDELAQQAAIQALRNALVVIFCVDIAKPALSKVEGPAWAEDLAVFRLIQPKTLIPAATKVDLPDKKQLLDRVSQVTALFGVPFTPISAKTGEGLQAFTELIGKKILEQTIGPGVCGTSHEPQVTSHGVALTARHRQAVTTAIADLVQAVDELKAGNNELAAMMLRTAYNALSDIEQPRRAGIDEQLLDRIFSRFCIGK